MTDSPYWQLSLIAPGEIVEGLDDIRQCLFVILTTQKGSDPLRPDFGADIYKAVDQPAQRVAPRLKATILEQVQQYEPRAEVLSIIAAIKGDAHISVRLTWRARSEAAAVAQNLDVEYYR